jgi:subfamily B ATP-binding cassette protein MsbA
MPKGIRNLVGTGLVQLTGSIVTAVLALGWLIYINWHLTLMIVLVLAAFGGAMSYAFRTLRPLFRERGQITAEVTGRLNQALGGVRVVKTYTAERREDLVFTKGAHRLFRNIAKSMTGVSGTTAFSSVIVGAIGVVVIVFGGRAIIAGTMTVGDLFQYVTLTALLAMPIVQIASIGTQISEAFAGWIAFTKSCKRPARMRTMRTGRCLTICAVTSSSRTCPSSTTRACRY